MNLLVKQNGTLSRLAGSAKAELPTVADRSGRSLPIPTADQATESQNTPVSKNFFATAWIGVTLILPTPGQQDRERPAGIHKHSAESTTTCGKASLGTVRFEREMIMDCSLCERIKCAYCHWLTLYHTKAYNEIRCGTCGYQNGFINGGMHYLLAHPIPGPELEDLGDYLPLEGSWNGPGPGPDWHRKIKKH